MIDALGAAVGITFGEGAPSSSTMAFGATLAAPRTELTAAATQPPPARRRSLGVGAIVACAALAIGIAAGAPRAVPLHVAHTHFATSLAAATTIPTATPTATTTA